jgi:hypothetical protein
MPQSLYTIGTEEEKNMADLIHSTIEKWGYANLEDDVLSWPTTGVYNNEDVTELITTIGKKSNGNYVILFDVHSEYEVLKSFHARYDMKLGVNNVYENADLYVGKIEYWKQKNRLM